MDVNPRYEQAAFSTPGYNFQNGSVIAGQKLGVVTLWRHPPLRLVVLRLFFPSLEARSSTFLQAGAMLIATSLTNSVCVLLRPALAMASIAKLALCRSSRRRRQQGLSCQTQRS
jgi:hypothetical protein